MARKTNDTLNSVTLTCNVCVSEAGTPNITVTEARAYVAGKWEWTVTPSGHDLCPVCAKRGELDSPEHKKKPKGKRHA